MHESPERANPRCLEGELLRKSGKLSAHGFSAKRSRQPASRGWFGSFRSIFPAMGRHVSIWRFQSCAGRSRLTSSRLTLRPQAVGRTNGVTGRRTKSAGGSIVLWSLTSGTNSGTPCSDSFACTANRFGEPRRGRVAARLTGGMVQQVAVSQGADVSRSGSPEGWFSRLRLAKARTGRAEAHRNLVTGRRSALGQFHPGGWCGGWRGGRLRFRR